MPHLLFPDFSLGYGEPEYRNGLCAQIGEMVSKAELEGLNSLTIELESGTVIALKPARRRFGWAGGRELFGGRKRVG